MEEIKLNISLAFRKEGANEFNSESVYDLDGGKMNRYLNALKKEMEAGKEDNADFLVSAISFNNGSYSHYAINDIQDLYEAIKANFNVSKDVKVSIHTTPIAFNFFRLMCAKQLNKAEIILEIPTANEELLTKWNYESLKKCEEASELVFNEAYANSAILLDSEHQSIELLRESIEHFSSHIHHFYFTKPLSDEQLANLGDIPGISSEGINVTCKAMNELGVGLNAHTNIYGNKAKNTGDLELYLNHSDDFEKITTVEQDDVYTPSFFLKTNCISQ